jgi:hypothetical protein
MGNITMDLKEIVREDLDWTFWFRIGSSNIQLREYHKQKFQDC